MKDFQKDILHFWFVESTPVQWFQINPDFDALITQRFTEAYAMGREGIFDDWRKSADGCLALCVLLDQLPRNMFRGKPEAFATDAVAILTAKHAISKGFDQVHPPERRRFIYLPFEHSEKLSDQKRCVELFKKMEKDDPLGYDYAVRRLKVIEQFGRFPHRNVTLGRENTPEEEAYLARPGAGF